MTSPGDDTRARILETAWQPVSFHFTDRGGLLPATARRRNGASRFGAAVVEARAMGADAGLEHLLRAWCAYVPEILPVSRTLEAVLVSGDDGADWVGSRIQPTTWRRLVGERKWSA